MSTFKGDANLGYPSAMVFENGIRLDNWPSRVKELFVKGKTNEGILCLGGLLSIRLHTPIKDLNLEGRVVTLEPGSCIQVVSKSLWAKAEVGLEFAEVNGATIVHYEIGVKPNRLGSPLVPYLESRGEEVINQFVGELVMNVSCACAETLQQSA